MCICMYVWLAVLFYDLSTPFRVIQRRIKFHINQFSIGGARDVMVIVVGNGHGDTSSNTRRD